MGLTLVDSGVWIDLLADRQTLQTAEMYAVLARRQALAIGDLVLTEVLQGARGDRKFREAEAFLSSFTHVRIVDRRVAVEAAKNVRDLRAIGITPRKTNDTLIATRCILDRIPLLYGDRDFDPFVEHLGLISALDLPGVS